MTTITEFFKKIRRRNYWTRRRILQLLLLITVPIGVVSATYTTISFYISAATGSLDPFYNTLHKYSKVEQYDVCREAFMFDEQDSCPSNCTEVETMYYYAQFTGPIDGLKAVLTPLFSFDLTIFWLFVCRWVFKLCAKGCHCKCPKCCSKCANGCQLYIECTFTILALVYMSLAFLFYELYSESSPYKKLTWIFSEDAPFPDSPTTDTFFNDQWYKDCVTVDPTCIEEDESRCAQYYNLVQRVGEFLVPLNVTYTLPEQNEYIFDSIKSITMSTIAITSFLSILGCFQNMLSLTLECCDTKGSCGPCLDKHLCFDPSEPDLEEETQVHAHARPATISPHGAEMVTIVTQPPQMLHPAPVVAPVHAPPPVPPQAQQAPTLQQPQMLFYPSYAQSPYPNYSGPNPYQMNASPHSSANPYQPS